MTTLKAAYLFVFEGFADWEPSFAIAELRRSGGRRIEVVGLTRAPVDSMGGLRVTPTLALDEVRTEDVAVFILPGGERWEQEPMDPKLEALLKELDGAGVPIAAICAASAAVASIGLLRGRRHTSNGLDYLKHFAPAYDDAARYVDEPAVRDRGLITASGLGAVEFAREIFEELDVLTAEDRAQWAAMFRSGRMPAP